MMPESTIKSFTLFILPLTGTKPLRAVFSNNEEIQKKLSRHQGAEGSLTLDVCCHYTIFRYLPIM